MSLGKKTKGELIEIINAQRGEIQRGRTSREQIAQEQALRLEAEEKLKECRAKRHGPTVTAPNYSAELRILRQLTDGMTADDLKAAKRFAEIRSAKP